MTKSNFLESGLLNLVLNNTNLAGIGDATGLRGSSTAGNLFIGLHTSAPAETANQTSAEATYTGYAREGVSRAGSAWTESNGTAVNAAEIAFDECTAGSNTVTHVTIGIAGSGTTSILYVGALTSAIQVSAGVTVRFAAGQLQVSED